MGFTVEAVHFRLRTAWLEIKNRAGPAEGLVVREN
jgi:hypothetical protein